MDLIASPQDRLNKRLFSSHEKKIYQDCVEITINAEHLDKITSNFIKLKAIYPNSLLAFGEDFILYHYPNKE